MSAKTSNFEAYEGERSEPVKFLESGKHWLANRGF